MLRRLILITTLIFTSIIFSQSINAITPYYDGMLDPTFVNGQQRGMNDYVGDVLVANNGKIYVGGRFISYDGYSSNSIIRLNSDGSKDFSFNSGSGLAQIGSDPFIDSISEQIDGKILITGHYIYGYDGHAVMGIARINTDGSFDSSFNSGGSGFNDGGGTNYPYKIVAQSNGKIMVVGNFTSYNGVSARGIVRLNSDGSIDATFNSTVGANNWVDSILVLSDGKYLIGGSFTSYNGTAINRIARLNIDGTLDTSFNPGAGPSSFIDEILLQNDGKYLIAGAFNSYGGISRSKVARLNADLTLDNSFIPGTFNGTIFALDIQEDNKIVVGGWFNTYNGLSVDGLLRLNADGSLDPTFILPTNGSDKRLYDLEIYSDSRILIGGPFVDYLGTTDESYFTSLNTDGSLDTSFGTIRMGMGSAVYSINKDSEDKLLVSGYFSTYNGNIFNGIIRFNPDMSVDSGFDTGMGANSYLEYSHIQNDGRIMIGGSFTNFNGEAINKIARLNSDGSIDPTFNPGLGPNYSIYVIQALPDGKYLVGGYFTSFNGVSKNHFVRLNNDGSLDTSFNTGTGPNSSVYAIVVLDDGKILIGGYFITYNGISRNRIARLNADGTLDTSFDVGTGANSRIDEIVIQDGNKILIGGYFTTYNGSTAKGLARLSFDGGLDNTFNLGGNYAVNSIVFQDDGKILVGGYFTSDEGSIRNNLIRLNTDGTPDYTFGSEKSLNGTVLAILSDNEKLYLGGWFITYDNMPVTYFTRLLNDQYAPTGSISINSGSAFTQSTSVILTLNAEDNISGVKDMMVCSNSSFTGCDWETYSTGKSWVFDSSLGIKTVYVKYRDNEGNESEVYSDTIALHRIVITDIGLIDDIPDQDRLWYYFTSTTPVIQGYTQANSTVYFKNGSKTYTVTADSNGDFKTTLYLGNGTTTLSYYSIDPYGNQTETRTLILIIGTEYFPDWLLIKLGLLPEIEEEEEVTEEEIEEEEEEEDIVIPEIEEETNTPIQIIGFDGDPLRDAEVVFDGISYITDGEGYIYVIDVEVGSHIVKLKINEEEYSQLLVLGEDDLKGGSIVKFEYKADYSIYYIFSCLVLIIMMFILILNKKKRNTEESRKEPDK